MKRLFHTLLLLLLTTALPGLAMATRIKDIATIHGIRDNQLIGYGLVTGLSGTGDDLDDVGFTRQSLVNMLSRQGVNLDSTTVDDLDTNNIAAVTVTATLPPFSKTGSRVDVEVSSMGTATSLAGGTLLMTPLRAPNGKVYAVAQGPLSLGAFAFGGKTALVQQNHPTVARIANGALVEKAVPMSVGKNGIFKYQLNAPDFTTASHIAQAINTRFHSNVAWPNNEGMVEVAIPKELRNNVVNFISAIESLPVQPDTPAKIVVNERTGTVVMGKDVRIDTVAVSHGNLSLIISSTTTVSQPNPLAPGQTVVTQNQNVAVQEDEGELVVLDMQRGVSIGEIANALNAIGATPRDLIAIFQAIKASGSLYGELVIL
jgi:flagellar P-ring protein precursor FlgI